MRAWPIVLGLLFIAPAAAEPVDLYVHLTGYVDSPMLTLPPPDDWAYTGRGGAGTHSASCIQDPTGSTNLGQDFHTLYAYFSPQKVQYERLGESRPPVHAERGVRFNVSLGLNATLTWVLETQSNPASPPAADGAPVAHVVPNLHLAATLRAGDAISVDDVAYNSGEILAAGTVGPMTLAGEASQAPPGGTVEYVRGDDGRHRYVVTWPLTVAANASIARDDGANLRVDSWLEVPACSGPPAGYIMPNFAVPTTQPGLRPHLTLEVDPPLAIHMQPPRLVKGLFVVDTEVASPFGPPDVANVTLMVDGPSRPRSATLTVLEPASCHCYPEPPYRYLWVWNATADGATPGDYVVTITAQNAQGTAVRSASAVVEVPREKASPGLPILFLAGALAWVAWRRR